MKRQILWILLSFCPCLVSTSELKTWASSISSMENGTWGPPGAPVSLDPLNFPPTATLNLTPGNDIPGTYTLYDTTSTTLSNYSISLTTPLGVTPYALFGNPFQVNSGGKAFIQIGGPGTTTSSIANNIFLNSGTLNLQGSQYDEFTGVIQGSGTALNIIAGSLQFSGMNTYLAPTSISMATLRLGASGTLPSTTDVTISGGILNLNSFNQTIGTFSGDASAVVITGTGSLTVTNTGTNTFPGNIELTSSPPFPGNAGGTFILGTGSTGSLELSGANSYSSLKQPGATTVNAGTLIAGNAVAFGTNSNLTIATGAIFNLNNFISTFNALSGNGTLELGTGTATFAQGGTIFSGTISSATPITATGLTYTGSNTLTLSGTNSYAGTTIISGGGTLAVSNLSSSVVFQVLGGTLQFSSPFTSTSNQGVSLSQQIGASAIFDIDGHAVTWAGSIGGGGAFTLVNSGSSATLTLTGSNNNYTGGTIINGGTLLLGSSTAFPNQAAGTILTIASGASLNMNGNSINVSTLSGSGTIALGSGTLSAFGGTTGSSSNYSGNISGTGGVTFGGNGTTLQLTGSNSYHGATTIDGLGTLAMTNSGLSSMSSGVVFSGSGGTLQALNALTSSLPITFTANGAINTGTSGTASTWTGSIGGSGNFTVAGSGTLTLSPSSMNNYSGQTIISSGTLKAGNSNSPFGMTSFIDVKPSGTLNLNNVSTSVTQLIGDPGAIVNLGSATFTITGGVDTSPYYGIVQGTGNIIVTAGAPTFMGTNTYSGTTTIQGGTTLNTLNLGSTSSIVFGTGGGTLQIGSNCTGGSASSATLVINGAATIATNTFNLSISGELSGSGASLTKIGQGTLTLTGMNNFMNMLNLEGGVLNVDSTSFGTPSQFNFQQFCGTLQSSGGVTITSSTPIFVATTGIFDTTGGGISIAAAIANPTGGPYGGLTKTGTGTLTLTGTNTYAGMTTILNGTLSALSSSLPLPAAGFAPTLVFGQTGSDLSPIFQAGGTFSSFPAVVFITSGTINTNGHAVTASSVIAGNDTATFTKAGANTLMVSGANIYTGPTAVTGGTLQAGIDSTSSSGPFGVGSAVSVSTSGATLDVNGHNATIGSLSGVSGSVVTLGSSANILTISNGDSLTFAGNITGGTGGVTLAAGTLTLTGTNTFTGPVQIQSGDTLATLQIQGSPSTSVGAIANDGALQANCSITAASYTQAAAAPLTLDFASLSNYGNISASGVVTLAPSMGSILNITNSGLVTPTGTVTLLQGSSLMNEFTIGTNAFTKATIQYTSTQLNLIFSSSGCQGAWSAMVSSGNWGVNGNWTSNCYPGINPATEEDSATFPNVMSESDITITLQTISAPLTSLTLHSMNFTGSSTGYTIQQAPGSSTTVTMDGNADSNPTIAISAGAHSLQAQIYYNQNGTLTLTGGTLTFPSTASVRGSAATLTISGSSGTLANSAVISPNEIAMSGGIINNTGTVSPIASLGISGGTFNNNSGGVLGAAAVPITISGGTVANNTGAQMKASALSVSDGSLSTQNPISVTTYTQESEATLTLDFPTLTTYGQIEASGALNLAGTLTLTNSGSVTPPTTGTIVLLQGSTLNFTQFTSANTSIFPSGTLSYSDTQVYLNFMASNCTGIWAGKASGNWGTLANWQSCVPGITGSTADTATFGSVSGGASSITATLANASGSAIDVNLNQLSFTSSIISYTLSQTSSEGSIAMVGSSPKISASAGSHTINVPISLSEDTTIALSGGATLTLGSSADVTGSATVTLQGTSGTLVNEGTFSPTSAILSGATLNNSGTFTPSSSLTISGGTVTNESGGTVGTGTLTLSSGSLTSGNSMSVTTYIQSGGTLTLDFPMLTPHGQVVASGALSLGGTLTITNSGSVSPSGQVNLLQGASLTGTFSTINNAFTNATVHTSTNTHRVYLNFGGCHGIWISPSSSNDYWGLDTNWSSASCYPGANIASAEDTATFNDVAGAPSAMTITMANSSGSAFINLTALYQLNFNASNTSFTINQYSGAMGNITMNAAEGPALISVSAGTHTLDVPVALGINTTLQLTGGTLNFGSAAAVTGSFTLTVSGTDGAWGNEATISPSSLVLESGTIDNYGTFSPTTLTIASDVSDTVLVGNFNVISPAGALSINGPGTTFVVNFLTMSSGTSFTIGQTGSPSVVNTNSLSSGTTFSIEGGSVENTLGGSIFSTTGFTISGGNIANTLFGSIYAPSGQPFTISGGNISNQSSGTFGSASIVDLASSLAISGGVFVNDASYTLAQTVQISGGSVSNISGGFFFSELGNLTISGGTVTNTLASYFFSTLGNLVITGGTVTNDATSNLFAEGGNVMLSGGLLSSSGLVSATGNYVQSGSGQLELGVLSTSSFGSVSADGSATLGGTLIVNALPNFSMLPGDKVNLITATSGVSSTFPTVSFQNFPSSLIASIIYLPAAVELDIEATIPAHINGASTHVILTSVNQHNFLITQKAYMLRNRMLRSAARSPVAWLGNRPNIDLSRLNTDPSTLLAQTSFEEQKQSQLISKVEKGGGVKTPWNVYAGPVSSFGDVKTVADQIGVGFSSVGGLVGFDYVFPKNSLQPCLAGAGAVSEFREKWIKAKGNYGSATIDRLHSSVYGTVVPKRMLDLSFAGLAGFGYTWDRLKRNAGPNQQLVAFSSTHEKIFDALFDIEYTFSRRRYKSIPKNFSITPLANIQYIIDWIEGYTEQGAGIYNLQVGKQTIQSLTTDFGARLDYLYAAPTWSFRFELDTRWQYQYFNLNQNLAFTAFNFTDQSTLVTSVAPGRNSLLVSADLLWTFCKGWQLEGYSSYQLNKLLYSTYFYLGFGKQF